MLFSAKKICNDKTVPNATTSHVDIIVMNYIYSQQHESQAKYRSSHLSTTDALLKLNKFQIFLIYYDSTAVTMFYLSCCLSITYT